MSQPDHDAITEQIRAARLTASPELRARVRAIAAAAPADPMRPRRELPWRRLALVLVPAFVAVALAVSLASGLTSSGPDSSRNALPAPAPELPFTGPARDATTTGVTQGPLEARSSKGGAAGSANLPATPDRAQLYEAELTLKVRGLSAATKRALRLTRDFHGYVRSVQYGAGAESGSASVVVRVPVGSVQKAIVQFSAIGAILDQHVSIQDVQPQIDARFRRLQAQRDTIAGLQAKLESPTLSAADRAALEQQLVVARQRLALLRKAQAAQRRQTGYATVSLDLRTAGNAIVVPHEPGSIGRALHRSGQVLADEAKVLLYVLIAGAPFLVLAGLAAVALTVRRRRGEARLLAR
jgi:Domain of unknown function (DUF4349)